MQRIGDEVRKDEEDLDVDKFFLPRGILDPDADILGNPNGSSLDARSPAFIPQSLSVSSNPWNGGNERLTGPEIAGLGQPRPPGVLPNGLDDSLSTIISAASKDSHDGDVLSMILHPAAESNKEDSLIGLNSSFSSVNFPPPGFESVEREQRGLLPTLVDADFPGQGSMGSLTLPANNGSAPIRHGDPLDLSCSSQLTGVIGGWKASDAGGDRKDDFGLARPRELTLNGEEFGKNDGGYPNAGERTLNGEENTPSSRAVADKSDSSSHIALESLSHRSTESSDLSQFYDSQEPSTPFQTTPRTINTQHGLWSSSPTVTVNSNDSRDILGVRSRADVQTSSQLPTGTPRPEKAGEQPSKSTELPAALRTEMNARSSRKGNKSQTTAQEPKTAQQPRAGDLDNNDAQVPPTSSMVLKVFEFPPHLVRFASESYEIAAPLFRQLFSFSGHVIVVVTKISAIGLMAFSNTLTFAAKEVVQKDGALPTYLVLYTLPSFCDLLMAHMNVPHYMPHIISNISLHWLCSSYSRDGGSDDGHDSFQSAGVHFELRRLVLRTVRVYLLLSFAFDGFSRPNSSVMMLEPSTRLIFAYIFSMIRKGHMLSPLCWFGWSVQVLISSFFPGGMFLNCVLLLVGLALLKLISLLQMPGAAGDRSTKIS